jgi:D-lactate dehydrogenase
MNPRDLDALPKAHRAFVDEMARVLPAGRMVVDPLRTFAFGTDASCYRLIPKVVVRVESAGEVSALLRAAARHDVACTFRAAGTSLSGQAVSDSVLVLVVGGFRKASIGAGAQSISLEPGIIGADANAMLAPHGRKIGPDPASIATAMIGGIAANNASGMCCGTSQNSYQTVQSMKLVFADGTELDTADARSRAAFERSHGALLAGLRALRAEILAEPALAERIREKYRIKNTTGYGINSFVDFEDPFDILLHLMIGSEGTLAFISEVTYRTVEEHAHKASCLAFFADMEAASRAPQALKTGQVSAVEMMDRPSLRSVESKPGLPSVLKTLPPDACALLVEVRAENPEVLRKRMEEAKALITPVGTLYPFDFTAVKDEYETLWNIRKGLFPALGAVRRVGTTVVIEDVAFPMKHFAAGTVALQKLFLEHGYTEGIIFGHALDSNVHFVFTQDFADPREVERYERFMEGVADLVVKKFDGAMKAEHGTGRAVAPFVALEWGEKAYSVMKRLKALFDPEGRLNPGVILADDPKHHMKDLKPIPKAHDIIDKCIECGFCEPKCCSRELTLTPRQRITLRREMARLVAAGETNGRLARLEEDYQYYGLDTCAADGLCATACPVGIDTGKLTKALRAEQQSGFAKSVAGTIGSHMGGTLAAAKLGFGLPSAAQAVLGEGAVATISGALHKLTGGKIPVWNRHMPTAAKSPRFDDVVRGKGRKVVYFPACVTRLWGPARDAGDDRAMTAAMLSLLEKAGYDVTFPKGLSSLCCGLSFESKGFPQLADNKLAELSQELLAVSDGGAIPVLCDTSPCVQRMKAGMDQRLRIFEPAEFIHAHLMDKLRFEKKAGSIAIHVTCSTSKMGLGPQLKAVAQACAQKVVQPAGNCCGFAGDLGLRLPELNASALSGLREAVKGCEAGYSNSRGCEIGLSKHGGIPYESIVYLVDRCTKPLDAKRT